MSSPQLSKARRAAARAPANGNAVQDGLPRVDTGMEPKLEPLSQIKFAAPLRANFHISKRAP